MRPRRRGSRAANLVLLAVLVLPWFVGAAWLLAHAITWASPHVARSDGLVVVIVVSAGALCTVLLTTWPMSDTDVRDARQALAARNVLRPASSRRPACPPRPRETR